MTAILFMSIQCAIAGEVPNSDETAKQISNNISHEFVTCAAYYSFASEGFRRSGHLEDALKIDEARKASIGYALIVAKNGRTQKMAEKVTLSRYELEIKSMGKEIENDISNISILINKYGFVAKRSWRTQIK